MAFGWQDQQPYGNLPGILSQIGWDDPNKMDPRNLPQGLLAAAQSPDMPAVGSQDAGPAPMQAPPMPPPRPPDIGTPMPLQGAQPPTQEGMPGGPMPMAQPPAAGQQPPAPGGGTMPGIANGIDKFATALGGIYGQGLPGDKLIELGAALAHPRGWAIGLQEMQANNQRTGALKQAQQLQMLNLQQKQAQQVGGAALIKRAYPSMSDVEAQAAAANPAMLAEATKRLNPSEAYNTETDAQGNTWQTNALNGQKSLLKSAPQPQLVTRQNPNGTTEQFWAAPGATTGPTVGTTAPSAPTTKNITQPDGSEVTVQWNPATGAWDPLKAPAGGNAVTSTTKLTEGQSKDLGFYHRGNSANKVFEPMESALTSATDALGNKVPLVGNYLQTKDYRKAMQAGREVLATILRKDSGAAITPLEMAQYGDIFLPQPGDDPDTIAQKRASRTRAFEGIRAGLGTAEIVMKELEASSGTGAPAAPAPPPTAQKYTPEQAQAELRRREELRRKGAAQ